MAKTARRPKTRIEITEVRNGKITRKIVTRPLTDEIAAMKPGQWLHRFEYGRKGYVLRDVITKTARRPNASATRRKSSARRSHRP